MTYVPASSSLIVTPTTKVEVPKEKAKVLMSKEGLRLLKDLYLIRSYSGFEEPLRRGVMAFLKQLDIPYINYNGNILGLNHPGAPLFSAHLDMVNTDSYKLKGEEYMLDSNHVFTIDSDACIRLYRGKDAKGKHINQTSLGADDKNGIWVILTLLQKGYPINFALCHSEESGGEGSRQIVSDTELANFISDCAYGIIIDRRNAHDIIGYENKYCMVLDDRLHAFAKEHKFKFEPTRGSVSDADRFSQLIECVNLSCGYYDPHSSKEYTNLNELWNTLKFCECILTNFAYKSASTKRMKSFKGVSSTTTYTSTYDANSSYWSRYHADKDKDKIEVKTTNFGKSDQKKTSGKKTKTTSMSTTTIDDTAINKDLIEEFIEGDGYLEGCLADGADYVADIWTWIVPLHPVSDTNNWPENSTLADSIATTRCPDCGEEVHILQRSIDQLFMGYYTGEEDVIGICTKCKSVQDVTEEIKSAATVL